MQSHDDLPYIDQQITQENYAAASALIAHELKSFQIDSLHKDVPSTYEPRLPELTELHAQSLAGLEPSARPSLGGIDLSRYEEPSTPINQSDLAQWRKNLRQAYTSHLYLAQRNTNLNLLERFGKNAWLISNSQVEDELKMLERELADVQTEAQHIQDERTSRQSTIKAEFEGLEEAWRSSLSKSVEAEIAVAGLQREILEARRAQS